MQIHFQEDDKLERTMLRIVKSLSTAEKRKTTWDDDGWGEILKELVQLSKGLCNCSRGCKVRKTCRVMYLIGLVVGRTLWTW